jgi:hypothetical protein
MLYIVILEVLLVAGMAVAVLLEEKKLVADFDRWLSRKPKKVTKHRYIHP